MIFLDTASTTHAPRASSRFSHALRASTAAGGESARTAAVALRRALIGAFAVGARRTSIRALVRKLACGTVCARVAAVAVTERSRFTPLDPGIG